MKLSDCHNIADFRELARRRLPYPVFHYIDGAADDERTKARNTASYDDCDLIPSVLAGVEQVDMRCTVMGKQVAMPLFLSLPRCNGCFTGRVSVRWVQRRRRLIHGSAFPRSPR